MTADQANKAERKPGVAEAAIAPVIATTALTRRYGPTIVALDELTMAVGPGITGLVGSNGAGKSTLIKILAGVCAPDAGGQAWMNGRPLALGSEAAAHHAGLRFIHQDLGLVPALDVIDNLALGQGYQARWWLSARAEAAAARECASRILGEAEISPNSQRLLDYGDAKDVGALCAAGDEAAIAARFRRFADAGVTDLSVRLLPIGADRDELIASKYRTRDMIAGLAAEFR